MSDISKIRDILNDGKAAPYEELIHISIDTKCDAIIKFGEANHYFDASMAESILFQYEKGYNISVKQEEALDRIITRFRIKV
ncbi:MAG: hypothetical protein ACTSU6_04805 [Candidatus Njordarchaeales archaeon]